MPFAIEALQCKSKLNNIRSRQFAETLWPELRPKEDNTIVQAATQNIKGAVKALLARVKSAVDRSEGGSSAQGPERHTDPETITAEENDDGFLEINIVKRIRTGNKLLLAATTDDQK